MAVDGTLTLVERAWARSRLDAWLDSTDPTLLLTGPAGSGKSTLVAQLAHGGARPTAVHACHGRMLRSTEPVPALAGIAATLARVIPGYAQAVLDGRSWRGRSADDGLDAPETARRIVLDSADGFAAYERALRRPVSKLASTGCLDRDVLVAIDGLDEASTRGPYTELAELFVLQAGAPAPRLRMLLATRAGAVAEQLGGVPSLDLAEDPTIVDSIDNFLVPAPRLRRKGRRRIAVAAQGSFVYAALAARSVETAIHPPAGLEALYEHMLADLDPLAADAFALLCGGRDDGLRQETLADMLGATPDEIDGILDAHRYLLADTEVIAPHHRCLREFLAKQARPADGRIADYLIDRWGGGWVRCDDRYAFRNVLPHLADAATAALAAGGPPTAVESVGKALRETIADPAYVTGAVTTNGVDDLRSGLSYAGYRLAGTAFEMTEMGTLATLLRDEGRTLRAGATRASVVRQLVYAAASVGVTDLANRLAAGSDIAEIQVLWATVELTASRAPEELRGHRAEVTAVSVAAGGTQAVSAARDGTTRLWRLASGRLRQVIDTSHDVAYVHMGPDAQNVVAAYADGTVDAWDTATGGEWHAEEGPHVPATAFAANGDASRGITGDPDQGATVWDLTAMAKQILRLPPQPGRVSAVTMTADGRHAALAAGEDEVSVWDLSRSTVVARFSHGRRIAALCLTPGADRLVIGDDEGLTVLAIDTDAPELVTDPTVARLATRARVTALAANPVFPGYVLFGTAMGQVAYVHVP